MDGTGIYYCGYADGRLHTLEPSGSHRWTAEAGDAVLAMPALAASGVWVGSIQADGTAKLLAYGRDNKNVALDITLPRQLTSPLVTVGDVTYASEGNVLTARDAKDSAEKWELEFDSEIALAAVSGTTIFISGDGHERPLHGVATDDGTLKWTKKHRGCGRHSSVTATRSTAFTVVDGALLASGEDGDLLWSYRPDGGVQLASNTATAAGDTVYVHGAEWLYAVDLTGTFRWRISVGELVTGTIARPLVRDGRIYAACSKGVAAIRTRDTT